MRCPDDGAASQVVDALPAGVKLGQYRIERMLGEGGMGFVYEATHEVLHRRTAIKMLRPEYAAHKHIVTRFLNEAKAANLINHQNIVNVYDYGNADDGSVYFVMEFLEGEALDDLMHKRRPMPVPLLLHVFFQIAKALGAAHAKQIIHRDLKPANVYVIAREENPYFIKLLDFGIAQLRGAGAVEGLTLAGSVLGTPQYMSPEQVMGANVDVRSDVWAMGVMMYRAATGQAAFKGEEFAELADKILHTVPQPPGEIMQLPVSLSQLIMSCLERDPEKRCPSVGALIAGLDKVCEEIRYTEDELLEAVRADSVAHGRSKWNHPTITSGKSQAPSVPVNQDLRPEVVKKAGQAKASGSPLRIALPVVAVAVIGGGVFFATRKGEAPVAKTDDGMNRPVDPPGPPPPVAPPEVTIQRLLEQNKIAEARELAVKDLEDAIANGKLQDKGIAVDAISAVRAKRASKLLYAALKEPPEVQRKAAAALCRLGLPDAAPKLRSALSGAPKAIQISLTAAMYCVGDPDSQSPLQNEIKEANSKDRLIAATALAHKGNPAGRAILFDAIDVSPSGTIDPLLPNDNWHYARVGLIALKDAKGTQRLKRELAQEETAVRAAALLAQADDKDALELLKRVADDKDASQRGVAAYHLAELGDKDALAWVPTGLASDSVEDRRTAAAIVGLLAQDAKQHLADLGKLANDSNSRVRMTAEAALLAL